MSRLSASCLAYLRPQTAVINFIEFRGGYFALGLAGFGFQVVDGGANLFYFGVGEFDCVYYRFFFYFFGAGFDHHDSIGGADDHDVQNAVAHFVVSRIDDELSADQAHAHCANRTVERNV